METVCRATTKCQIQAIMETKPFKKFIKNVLEDSEPEPFCPFIFSGYCNDAYSDKCYHCEHAAKDYLGEKDTL